MCHSAHVIKFLLFCLFQGYVKAMISLIYKAKRIYVRKTVALFHVKVYTICMKENLVHARTCVYNINYHVVWSVKYPKKTKRVLSLHKKKRNKVNDYIHKITKHVADYCAEEKIAVVVVGNMKGIRKGKNLGRMNQQLHAFPYEKIIQKLRYKLARKGIRMIVQKESYSSQCKSERTSSIGRMDRPLW